MKWFIILLYLGLCGADMALETAPAYNCSYCQPEQIHIAFGEKSNDIVVTWSTFDNSIESVVQYGAGAMTQEARGTQELFTDGGAEQRQQWIHRVTLRDLQYDTMYIYHCGSMFGWSERFSFRTPPAGEQWTVRAAIYGDMGTDNAHSLSYLQDEAERNEFDVILHVGDFAYDMNDKGARVGDEFMRQIQPLAAIVPYMTCPGNHEEAYNFSNYKARFSMPRRDRPHSMFYSWNLGPIHFISVNTEAYYFLNYGLYPLFEQYSWLVADLEEASKPENRAIRPWIVVYGHRPLYCYDKYDECRSFRHRLPNRVGLPVLGMGLERLLGEYGVDLVVWAHEHSYERTWPLYDGRVYNGSHAQPYVNPGAPTQIITGSAGCSEVPDPDPPAPHPWTAFRSYDYGFTRFVAHNRTHIYLEQVSVDKQGEVIDHMWLVRDHHGPYNITTKV